MSRIFSDAERREMLDMMDWFEKCELDRARVRASKPSLALPGWVPRSPERVRRDIDDHCRWERTGRKSMG